MWLGTDTDQLTIYELAPGGYGKVMVKLDII